MVGIFDPQLPPWIKDSLTRGVPALIGRYTQELGALRKFKPTIMVSWEGPTPGIMSREGSTLHGLIAMRYAGAGLLEETDDATPRRSVVHRARGRAFLAGPDRRLRIRARCLDHRRRRGAARLPRRGGGRSRTTIRAFR